MNLRSDNRPHRLQIPPKNPLPKNTSQIQQYQKPNLLNNPKPKPPKPNKNSSPNNLNYNINNTTINIQQQYSQQYQKNNIILPSSSLFYNIGQDQYYKYVLLDSQNYLSQQNQKQIFYVHSNDHSRQHHSKQSSCLSPNYYQIDDQDTPKINNNFQIIPFNIVINNCASSSSPIIKKNQQSNQISNNYNFQLPFDVKYDDQDLSVQEMSNWDIGQELYPFQSQGDYCQAQVGSNQQNNINTVNKSIYDQIHCVEASFAHEFSDNFHINIKGTDKHLQLIQKKTENKPNNFTIPLKNIQSMDTLQNEFSHLPIIHSQLLDYNTISSGQQSQHNLSSWSSQDLQEFSSSTIIQSYLSVSSSSEIDKNNNLDNSCLSCEVIQTVDVDAYMNKEQQIKQQKKKKRKRHRIRDQKYMLMNKQTLQNEKKSKKQKMRQKMRIKKQKQKKRKMRMRMKLKMRTDISKQKHHIKLINYQKIHKRDYNRISQYKTINQFKNQVLQLKNPQQQLPKDQKKKCSQFPTQFFNRFNCRQVIKIKNKDKQKYKNNYSSNKQFYQHHRLLFNHSKFFNGIIQENKLNRIIYHSKVNNNIYNKQNIKNGKQTHPVPANNLPSIPKPHQKLQPMLQKRFLSITQKFNRPQKLQQVLINHQHQKSQAMSFIMHNNIYLQNLTTKIPLPPKIPLTFPTPEQYQNIFLQNLKSQLCYSVRQKIKQLFNRNLSVNNLLHSCQQQQQQKQPQEYQQLFKINILSQIQFNKQGLCQLQAQIIDEFLSQSHKKNKNIFSLLNHQNYKSKYRLFLLTLLNTNICYLAQIIDMRKYRQYNSDTNKQQTTISLKLITSPQIINNNLTNDNLNLNQQHTFNINFPIQASIYHLLKVTTQARQYQSIINLKYSPLSPLILNPLLQSKFNNTNNINNINNQQIKQIKYIKQNIIKLQNLMKNYYNPCQIQAIKKISNTDQGIQLLQGPPGTGKTSTLLGILSCQYDKMYNYNKIIQQINNHKKYSKNQCLDYINHQIQTSSNYYKILICTPSNSAIDLITNRIIKDGLICIKSQNNGIQLPNQMANQKQKSIITPQKQPLKPQQTPILQQQSDNSQDNPRIHPQKNIKFPFILRIGLPQKQLSQLFTNNSLPIFNNQSFISTINLDNQINHYYPNTHQKYHHGNVLLKIVNKINHVNNYNLYHIINQLFFKQFQMHHFYISKTQINKKINDIDNQIKILQNIINKQKQNKHIQQYQYLKNKQIIQNIINLKQIIIKSFLFYTTKSTTTKIIKKKYQHLQNYRLKDLIKFIQRYLVSHAQIILTTLTTSYSEKILCTNPTFTCLIVDEAGQATQPSMLIPLQYGIPKVILIGDQCQLPPTINNHELNKSNFNRSLFERLWQTLQNLTTNKLISNNINLHMLTIQYRMSSLIKQYPNISYYQNKLGDSIQICMRTPILILGNKFKFQIKQVCFIDCINCIQEKYGNSYLNKIQAQCIVEIVCTIMKNQLQKNKISYQKRKLKQNISIGVITPYSEQQKYINHLLNIKKKQLFNNYLTNNKGNQHLSKQHINNEPIDLPQITVSTVDSYQGQQRDIILISTVRSNSRRYVGFLDDERRINVALTRAKYCLITVGSSLTLKNNTAWQNYINWVQSNGTYLTYNPTNQTNQSPCQQQTSKTICNNIQQLMNSIFNISLISPDLKVEQKKINGEQIQKLTKIQKGKKQIKQLLVTNNMVEIQQY